jgi:hypothetical protein
MNEMSAMYRVLIGQHKYFVRNQGGSSEVVKTGEFQTFNYKGHNLPKLGGVIEDKLMEIVGYVYDESAYDEQGNRLMERSAPYDWTNPFVHIGADIIEKYEVKDETEVVVQRPVAI